MLSSCGEVMNAPAWRAEPTSALAEILVVHLFFLSLSLARVVVLQSGVHSSKEEVIVNKKETDTSASVMLGSLLWNQMLLTHLW